MYAAQSDRHLRHLELRTRTLNSNSELELKLELELDNYSIPQCMEQGVVTYMSPVEAFATGIKNLDRQKSPLIA